MNLYKVYCYTGKNNKKYIGMTHFSLDQRAGKNGYKYMRERNSKFGNAIKKYGFDFFTSEILEENLTFEQACEKEKYYINYYDSYKNGYNTTLGGEGNSRFDLEEIYNLWKQGKSHQEIIKEVGCSDITIQRALDSFNIEEIERIRCQAGRYHIQKVYQYDLEGNFIQEYESYSEAGRQLNIPHCNIIKCIRGKRKSAGGFQWSIEKVKNLNPCERNIYHNSKKILQYDENFCFIKEYSSLKEASQQNNTTSITLTKHIKNQSPFRNFYYKYKE